MWDGQTEFEITVTVDGKLFGRDIAPLHNKVKLQRKVPADAGAKSPPKKADEQEPARSKSGK